MSSKLERDIEEVLAQVDKFPQPSRLRRLRRHLSNAVGAAGVAIASLPGRGQRRPGPAAGAGPHRHRHVFGDSFGSQSIVRLFIISGIVLFIGAFIFSLRRRSSSRLPEKRWRGQPMDLRPGGAPWWKRGSPAVGRPP
jgi:hypothetical protein